LKEVSTIKETNWFASLGQGERVSRSQSKAIIGGEGRTPSKNIEKEGERGVLAKERNHWQSTFSAGEARMELALQIFAQKERGRSHVKLG